MGYSYDKQHAMTIKATASVKEKRFIAYDGGYATSAGGAKDCIGASEFSGEPNDLLSVVTGFSYLVEAGEAIDQFDFVKPGVDGRAVKGTATDHCGRALEYQALVGKFVEVQILPHRHP